MKERLDTYLVKINYYISRNKARLAIENGDIMVNDKIITKTSYLVNENDQIKIVNISIPYVSRGGLKLEKALDSFSVDVKSKKCIDIGASTGGFSDCLTKKGAMKVYAIDVGSDQLDEQLKDNPKIISLENTNFREIDPIKYKKEGIEIITCDVSFISLSYMFDNVSKILNEYGLFIALIKPQFETSKKEHNKKGVVNDKKIHLRVIDNLIKEANKYALYCNKLDYSPIKGDKSGNIEYLSLFSFKGKNINLLDVSSIIELAFSK